MIYLYLLVLLAVPPVLQANGKTPRYSRRRAAHRAPGLPRVIKGDGPATVTGLARAENRAAALPVVATSGPSTGQLELIH